MTILPFQTNANSKSDSLLNLWENKKLHDTLRLKSIHDFIWEKYIFSNPDSATFYSSLMLDYAIKKEQQKYISYAYNTLGVISYVKGDYLNAIANYEKSLEIDQKTKNKRGIAAAQVNIGVIHKSQGNYRKALEYYLNGLKHLSQLKDSSAIATALNNIGNIYGELEDYDNALRYLNEALQVNTAIKYKRGIAGAYNNIGTIYQIKNDYPIAIEFFNKSVAIKAELNDKPGLASTFHNIGMLYGKTKANVKAKEYYLKAMELYIQLNDPVGKSEVQVSLSESYYRENNLRMAIQLAEDALKTAEQNQQQSTIALAAQALYKYYKHEHNHLKALNMYELYNLYNDSINNDNNKNEIMRLDFKYHYEKKAAADSVKTIEEKKIANVKLAQEKTFRYALYGGLLLTILFGIFMVNRLIVTGKQKRIIQLQKQEVEHQKLMVEEKQKEIVDSIHYAKRIQEALLPTEKQLERILKKSKGD